MPSLVDVEATIDLICASNVSLLSKIIPSNFNSCTILTGAPLRYKPGNSGYFVLEREITSALVFRRVDRHAHLSHQSAILSRSRLRVPTTATLTEELAHELPVWSLQHNPQGHWQVPQTNHECK